MVVLAFEVELHIPQSRSLKAKRSTVQSILATARHRFGVAAAEVAYQDQWQRAALGFAAVSSSERHATEIIDEVDRLVWSYPDVQVLGSERRWLE